MCGELGVIIELAKENVLRGDGEIKAIDNARKQFDFALNEALNYEYKGVKQSKADRLREEYETEMIKQYSGLVYNVAMKYRNTRHYDEAVQEAYFWLLHCIRNYDSSRGVKFTTYAMKIMWGKVYKYICKLNGGKLKRTPTGKKTEKGNIQYNETFIFEDVYSLDGPIEGAKKGVKDEELTLGGMIEYYDDGFDKIEDRMLLESVIESVKRVSSHEKYYGFDMVSIVKLRIVGETMTDIATMFGTYQMMIKRLLVKLQRDIGKELRKVC